MQNSTSFNQKQPPEVFYKKKKRKETLAQVFSSDFFEIFKKTFLQNTSGRLILFCRGVFKTLSKIYGGKFYVKIVQD